MVSAGEKKTAYFYKIDRQPMYDEEISCDAFFLKSFLVSKCDLGDHYQYLIKRKLEYESNIKRFRTRDSAQTKLECLLYPSDAETLEENEATVDYN